MNYHLLLSKRCLTVDSFLFVNRLVETREPSTPLHNLVSNDIPMNSTFEETIYPPFSNHLEVRTSVFPTFDMFTDWVPSEPFNNDTSLLQQLPNFLSENSEKTVYLANDSSHFAQYSYDTNNLRDDSFVSSQNKNLTTSLSGDEYDSSDDLDEIFLPIPKKEIRSSPRIDFMDERSNRSVPFQQPTTGHTHNQSRSPFCTLIMEGNQKKATPIPRPIPRATEMKKEKPEKKKEKEKKKKKKSVRRRLNFSGTDERALIMKWISSFIGGSTYLESAEALFLKYYNQPLMIGTRVNVFVEELKMNVTITIGRTADLLYYSFNSMKNNPKQFNMGSFF